MITILALAIALAVAIAVVGFLLLDRVRNENRSNAEVDVAASILTAHVYNYDLAAVRSVGEALGRNAFVHEVIVLGAHDNIVFNSAQNSSGPTKVLSRPLLSPSDNTRKIGSLRIRVDDISFFHVLDKALIAGVIAFIAIFIPSYAAMNYYTWRYVEDPLRQLSAAIETTLESEKPTPSTFHDDSLIGRFAKQFNIMQNRLISVQADLQEKSVSLQEHADVLEELLTGTNEAVRHFNGAGTFRDYSRKGADNHLLAGIPTRPLYDYTEIEAAIRQSPGVRSVRFVGSVRDGAGKPKALSRPYDLEIDGPGDLLRSVSAVELSQRDLAIIVRDITELRRLEEATNQARRLESLGALTGGVAHDMNNILGIILGNLQLIHRRKSLDADTRAKVETMLKAGRAGADFLQSLLSFSRQRVSYGSRIDVAKVLEEMRPLLSSALDAGQRIQIDAEPGLWVISSPAELGTAILNLVVNARDAMAAGGTIRVVANRHGQDEPRHALVSEKSTVSIKVIDQGAGIPTEHFNRIGDPFYTTKPIGKGTGMGLALVHACAHRFNGRLTYWNNPVQGATFALLLPERPGPEPAESRPVPAQARTEIMREGRILLVDDQPELAEVLCELIETRGHVVTVAHSLAAFREQMAKTSTFDLIVTDMALPDGTGLDVRNVVHSISSSLPVVLISGHLPWAQLSSLEQDAFHAVLTKPVDVDEFLNAIEKAVRKSSAHA